MADLSRAGFLRLAAASTACIGVGAHAQQLETVKVGGIQLPTNAPLFIAMEKGFFARQGIKVELVWFSAASSVFSAVVSRDIDVGVTSATAATYNLAARGGFKIIGGTTRDVPHFPLNSLMVSNKAFDAGFTELNKMAGRRFGMTTAGSSQHYHIGQLLKKNGLSMAGVVLVPLENYGNMIAALQTNQIDAAVLPPAMTQRLLDAKGAHLLTWSGDEVPMLQGVVCTSPQTITRRRDVIRNFMAGYVDGAQEYHRTFNQVDDKGTPQKRPGHAELVDIIARYAGIKPVEAETQMAWIIPDLVPDKADILAQIAFWQEQGLVSKTADFGGLFDFSLLPGTRG